MAAVAAVPSLYSTITTNTSRRIPASSSSSSSAAAAVSSTSSLPFLRLPRIRGGNCATRSSFTERRKRAHEISRSIRALADETLVPEEQEQKEEAPAAEQPVSVPVSPSDILTMFFQADGLMEESAIPTVTKALEDVEGINDLKVQILEGIASVELTKQTTVQATGVASNLVEVIQGSGFKLQTLNLSFGDEEVTN